MEIGRSQEIPFKISDVFLVLIYCVIFDIIWIPFVLLSFSSLFDKFAIFPNLYFYPFLTFSIPVSIILPIFVKRKYGMKLRDLGITSLRYKRDVFLGILAYLVVISVSIIIFWVAWAVLGYPLHEPGTNNLIRLSFSAGNIFLNLLLIGVICIYTPIFEELYFRGYMYQAFRGRMETKEAVCWTALIFAILHFHFVLFLHYFAFGIASSYLFEKRRSLIPSISLHILNNSIAIVLLVCLN